METIKQLKSLVAKFEKTFKSSHILHLSALIELLDFLTDQMKRSTEEIKANWELFEEVDGVAGWVGQINNGNKKHKEKKGLSEEEKTAVKIKNKKIKELSKIWDAITPTLHELELEIYRQKR